MVALGDPAAGNLSPGVLSPPGSPSSKGGKGKTKKGKGKGGKIPSASFKYNKSPAKPADPRGRAKTLTWTYGIYGSFGGCSRDLHGSTWSRTS